MATISDHITANPDICMGQSAVRGMRITAAFVFELLAFGMSHEEVLKACPELEDDIQQCYGKSGMACRRIPPSVSGQCKVTDQSTDSTRLVESEETHL